MSAVTKTSSELRHVFYGSEKIEFTLLLRDLKTLAITVHPDLRVEVIAPQDTSESAILSRVRTRARWILRQRRRFMSWMPKPSMRRYRSGETHRYLGKQYRLKIVSGRTTKVNLKSGFIEVHLTNDKKTNDAKNNLVAWYHQRADIRFRQEMKKALKRMRVYELPEPKLRLRRMSKRWGSCTAKREILLNPELIKAPGPCIEYVIVHELCHLKHPNHSAAFFRMLDAILPDWQSRKQRLEQTEI
jgi:predicted metal-dependent hydrolase